MSDLIRREDAIGACAYETFECYEARKAIRNLPSADRPRGEWIYCEDDEGQDGYRCSECGFFVPWYYDYEDSNYILDYKACPHCLAKMKGADDE